MEIKKFWQLAIELIVAQNAVGYRKNLIFLLQVMSGIIFRCR